MTLMRGSFLNHVGTQGFSESWHATDPSTTYQSMLQKMNGIGPVRALLSVTTKQPEAFGMNPVPGLEFLAANIPGNLYANDFIRISDELVQRDVSLTVYATPAGWVNMQGNLHPNLAAKVIWKNAAGQQIAVTYLHCIPVDAVAFPLERPATFVAQWTTRLNNYCAAVAAQGLGFKILNLTPAAPMGPITAVTYSPTSGYYTFTMTNGVPQGKFRVRIAGMRSLRYLNGRWPAQNVGANQFMLFRPAALQVWDNTGTALALSGYNNGVAFSNYTIVPPSTATVSLLTTRKLGRPFYLQRGRGSRRAAA